MVNNERCKDQIGDMRAAGLPSVIGGKDHRLGVCLNIANPEEKAEYMITAECRRKRAVVTPRSPIMPENSVGNLLAIELSKSRFAAFKEKFSEDMYFKKAKLGHAKPAGAKPEHITNTNTTFGCSSTNSEKVYPIILPQKTAQQINEEYASFHDKYILSHNHYFPAEQVNRKYSKAFNRRDTFGKFYGVDDNGGKVKRCMQQCFDQVIIVSKTQMDYIDRTYGRLGKKYKKYPYVVPPDMTHGIPTSFSECDGKMLIDNISPCVNTTKLIDAFGYLNMWRQNLHKRHDFHMYDLNSMLERHDTDKKGKLPFNRIIEIMHKMHLRIDGPKIRIAMIHFGMLDPKKSSLELVDYKQFCRLLSIHEPLPTTGNISSLPANIYTKDTIYRLFCADLKKKPNEGRTERKPFRTDDQQDDDLVGVKDLVQPQLSTLLGLGHSDYQRHRSKYQLERIFKNVLTSDELNSLWEKLPNEYQNQNDMFSVNQIRSAIDKYQIKKVK
ncbi:uncharacterized protein Dwil_GK17019 [Drosophila willistoni]|uniref:EFHB C-terminal EF-hand domain-containing protein n=1 Tax=Drosophila willistoni TaxID=7260 RepID=B4MKP3_DROWI|nr:EF-hand domain-containing family member B [Drosophila willistoni]EDW72749.1 uncharacterized protein Dwil_GK17019 [Drosophila willistoni]